MTINPPSSPPRCPFCDIASAYPPISPTTYAQSKKNDPHPNTVAPPSQPPTPDAMIGDQARAHLILSTKTVLAFLDIMPLTRGHVLVAPRGHFEKLGDMGVGGGREVGQWLPIISRVVMRTLFDEDSKEFNSDWNWNVVQNNGVRAAQQVPHVHFHIIPRPSDRQASEPGQVNKSYVMFGRGQREELDDDEGESLARLLREELAREVVRVRNEEGIDLECEFNPVDRKSREAGKL
ncbi:HIT domain protein [Aspergillus ellipticus CBS 707.79]|uniref:HIT domain protein n=1 Tax=Aspergillus ellipticus CBS 707.79 TaxID=1448320 RepID=A0A319DNW3_9EURO|nr:HIT domain protein [Aspergillus ellipticus CBS 707.79]